MLQASLLTLVNCLWVLVLFNLVLKAHKLPALPIWYICVFGYILPAVEEVTFSVFLPLFLHQFGLNSSLVDHITILCFALAHLTNLKLIPRNQYPWLQIGTQVFLTGIMRWLILENRNFASGALFHVIYNMCSFVCIKLSKIFKGKNAKKQKSVDVTLYKSRRSQSVSIAKSKNDSTSHSVLFSNYLTKKEAKVLAVPLDMERRLQLVENSRFVRNQVLADKKNC